VLRLCVNTFGVVRHESCLYLLAVLVSAYADAGVVEAFEQCAAAVAGTAAAAKGDSRAREAVSGRAWSRLRLERVAPAHAQQLAQGNVVYAPLLLHAAGGLCEHALARLDSPAAFREDPQLAMDVFELFNRLLHRCPVPFMTSPLVHRAAKATVWGATVQQRAAFCAVMHFLTELVRSGIPGRDNPLHATYQPPVMRLLEESGLDLVRGLVAGVAGGQPLWAVHHPDGCLTDVLMALFMLCKDPAMAVVTQAVDGLPDTTASREDCEAFKGALAVCATKLAASHSPDALVFAEEGGDDDDDDDGESSDSETEGGAGGHGSGGGDGSGHPSRRDLYRELRTVLLNFSDLCGRNLARERRRRRAAETAARGFA